MSHTFRTINRYHDQFESYKNVITPKSSVFWVSIIAITAFIYSFSWYVNKDLWPASTLEQNHRLFVVMGFEVVALICWFKLQDMRDKLVVESTRSLLRIEEKNIRKLKKIWLEKTLGIPSSKFLGLARDIDDLLNLEERNKSPFSLDAQRFLSLIFTMESKNRILAMFMGACAAIIGLSISAGASVENLFSFVEGESINSILSVIFISSVFLMLTSLVFWYLILVFATVIGSAFDRLDGLNSSSNRRVKTFINQLVVLHELPKGRVNVLNRVAEGI